VYDAAQLLKAVLSLGCHSSNAVELIAQAPQAAKFAAAAATAVFFADLTAVLSMIAYNNVVINVVRL